MEENTKKSFITEHPVITFWIRVVSWIIFAGVLPFTFIAFRFNIFKENTGASLSGWGIIAVIIIALVVIALIKYAKAIAKVKNDFLSQCIDGFCRFIIPLVVLLIICNIVKKDIDLFLQALGCVILCESVAIPLNPFPSLIKKIELDDTGKNLLETIKELIIKGK